MTMIYPNPLMLVRIAQGDAYGAWMGLGLNI